MDGGGTPRALAARGIFPDAAVLAAGTRFARLFLGLDRELPESGVEGVLAGVAQRLLAEAKWGWWDVEFATRLSERASPEAAEPPSKAAAAPAVDQPPPGGRENRAWGSDDRRRHLHGRESGLPGHHVGTDTRLSEQGWYEKKMLSDREPRRAGSA